VVCSRRLERLMAECRGIEGEEARNLEQVKLTVAGLWYSVSRNIRVHNCECVLLAFLFRSFLRPSAICASFIVARVELFVVELASSMRRLVPRS